MAWIWFADAMASCTGMMWGKRRFIDPLSSPAGLRWCGWFMLLGVPLITIGVDYMRH
jgi:hypothetical protein